MFSFVILYFGWKFLNAYKFTEKCEKCQTNFVRFLKSLYLEVKCLSMYFVSVTPVNILFCAWASLIITTYSVALKIMKNLQWLSSCMCSSLKKFQVHVLCASAWIYCGLIAFLGLKWILSIVVKCWKISEARFIVIKLSWLILLLDHVCKLEFCLYFALAMLFVLYNVVSYLFHACKTNSCFNPCYPKSF